MPWHYYYSVLREHGKKGPLLTRHVAVHLRTIKSCKIRTAKFGEVILRIPCDLIHCSSPYSSPMTHCRQFPKTMMSPDYLQELGVASEETHLESVKRYSDFTRLHQLLQRTPELLRHTQGGRERGGALLHNPFYTTKSMNAYIYLDIKSCCLWRQWIHE